MPANPARQASQQTGRGGSATGKAAGKGAAAKGKAAKTKSPAFTAEEKAAMQARAREARTRSPAEALQETLDKIASLPEPDRSLAKRVHALVMHAAPGLVPRLWYGMPAYAKDGNVVCFFQSGQKFKARYCTLGFSDKARLDDGVLWPVAFAVTGLDAAQERRITQLVSLAVGAPEPKAA